MRVYVAGPMSGLPLHNYPAFNATTDRLRAAGIDAVNPAENGLPDTAEWDEHMRADIAQLVTCDAIVLLPGWEWSKGATLEHHIANALGLRIFQTVEGLLAERALQCDSLA